MSKTQTGFRRPHCLAPVGGGGGYLLTGLFRVNRSFQTFLRAPVSREISSLVSQKFDRKNRLGPPRGFPQVRDDSIEGWEHTHLEPKIKRLVGGVSRFRWVCARRRRLSSWRPFARQPIVIEFLANRRRGMCAGPLPRASPPCFPLGGRAL